MNQKEVCTIYGTQGSLEFSFFGDGVQLKTKNGVEVFSFTNPKCIIQRPIIAPRVAYFLGNDENPCSATDGLLVMDTLERLGGRIN